MTAIVDKREYFIKAILNDAYRNKKWVLSLFADGISNQDTWDDYPFAIRKNKDNSYSTVDTDTGEELILEGAYKKDAPFKFMDAIVLAPDDLPNVRESLITTYGNVLVNAIALIYPFGDKIDFQTGRFKVSDLESIIETKLVDTPADGEELPADKVSVAQYKLFNDGIRYLEGFSQLCVPSATEKTMTVSAKLIKRRNELLKEHKDELGDPVVQAKIANELVKMDREWMAGDPGARFYIKNKSYDVIRKKLFTSIGEESGFGKKGHYITNSLEEGIKPEQLPDVATSLRHGAYSRGAWTALGGVEAKNNYRIFQNTVVVDGDCGSKLGMRLTIPFKQGKHFISSYVIEDNGKLTLLTKDNIKDYVGRPITLRSPAFCKTPKQNVCATCIGANIAKTPHAIPTYASDLGSIFLSLSLAVNHFTALTTNNIDYINSLK